MRSTLSFSSSAARYAVSTQNSFSFFSITQFLLLLLYIILSVRHVYVCKFAMLNVCLSQGQGVFFFGARFKGERGAAATTSMSEWVFGGGVHLNKKNEGYFSLCWLFVCL